MTHDLYGVMTLSLGAKGLENRGLSDRSEITWGRND